MQACTPTRVVTTEEMRTLDRAASEELGVPGRVLMENAGAAVAREALEMLEPGARALVVCGPGNNGGDGLVVGRHLANAGAPVDVLLLTEALKGDAAANLEALRKAGCTCRAFTSERVQPFGRGDLVVDALFGIGLTRTPDGSAAEAIAAMNLARERGAQVLSVDVPSGLCSDTGRPLGFCVQADRTVTFAYLKRGLVVEPGASLAGRVSVADISIPRCAESRLTAPPVFLLREDGIRAILPQRATQAHKGNCGHVLVVAGSPGRTGAAALTCRAALRGGAGLVTLVGREADVATAQAFAPEVMGEVLPGSGPLRLDDLPGLLAVAEGKTVLACGPGLARGPETAPLLGRLLEDSRLPAVLDADALNALAEQPELLRVRGGKLVLTPHPGEMARLTGLTTQQVQEDRLGVARAFADRFKLVVVLKGARTVVADVTGGTAVNPTGNPGMATAGSGDVLTGLCAALLAQGVTPGGAACAAVFVHGLAGDRVRERRGAIGLVASDLLEGISEVWASWGV